MAKDITIPGELLESAIWNNGKPFSEAQAYIQFIRWCNAMGGDTHFIHGNMITLKSNEFIMPQRKIAESLFWTQSAVNRFLKKLVTMNQCRINNESKMTRISIRIVAVEQKSESIVNQEPPQANDLFDNAFGGGTNDDITNNYNIYNNNNIAKDSNTTNNNNIFKKTNKNVDVDNIDTDNDIGVVQSKKPLKAKPYTAKPKDLEMVKEYFKEKHPDYMNQAEIFWNHYESIGWFKGKTKIKIWRRAVATWVSNVWEKPGGVVQKSKRSEWLKKYRKGAMGDWLVYCTNNKCKHYGSSCFAPSVQHIKQGCKCGHGYNHERPKDFKKIKEDVKDETNEPEITWEEFSQSQRQEKPTARSGTSEGNSQHISGAFDSLFQSGPRRGKS